MKKINLLYPLFFLLFSFSTKAQTIELAGVKYTLNGASKTATATHSDAEITDVVIQPLVSYEGDDYTVTTLSERAFYSCRALKTLKLPATIDSIGGYAFLGCQSLERVDTESLESWLKIKFTNGFANPLVYAHHLYISGTLLNDLVLPDGLAKVPDNAFVGASISTLKMPSSLFEIGSLAFYECTSLKNLNAGTNLRIIGAQAFDRCTGLVSATLAPALTHIGNYAFNECTALSSVTFGAKIMEVGTDAFAGCDALRTVDITDLKSWCEIEFANIKANPLTIAHNLTLNGQTITKLDIPSGISEIKPSTFAQCATIENVTLGPDVVKVGDKAFNSCPALESVICDGPVNTIGDYAFENCTKLHDIILPSSLTSIGEYALYGTSVTDVTLPSQITTLPDGVFGQCAGLKTIRFNDNLKTIGFGCFFGCEHLQDLQLPESIEKIGKSAFNGCRRLETVHLGGATQSISAFAFGSCPALKDIYTASIEPPIAPESTFSTYSATLHVPENSLTAYRDDSTWGRFENIVTTESSTTEIQTSPPFIIDGHTLHIASDQSETLEIALPNGKIIYRGLQKNLKLSPGIYIIRLGRTIHKIKIG